MGHFKHGDAKQGHMVRLYNIWARMKCRCTNRTDELHRRRYLDRGITVCEEWEDYCTFKEWALANGYDDSLEIDRIDNNKGYSPENCRWATRSQQVLNRENTRYFSVNGVEKPLKEWCNIVGANYKTMHGYLMKGQDKAVEEWFVDAIKKVDSGRKSEIRKPHIVRERIIKCAMCGKAVVANSGRQKFCNDCYRKRVNILAMEGYYRRKGRGKEEHDEECD